MSSINEPPNNQLINHSLEVDADTFANEHSDKTYEDTVASTDEGKQEPVLTRLYDDQVIRGFPTKRLDFNSDEELDRALGELVGELVWDSPIGISQQSVQTGIVRKSVLYLPDENRTSYCWDIEELNKIAERTGLMVVGDRFQYETDNTLMSFVSTGRGMEQLATNEIELFLFVPHHYAENTVLAKHYYEVMRSAKEAGVKCKYLLPKLVRTRSGETKLGCENTMFRSHRSFGRDETQARDAVFNRGALYWDSQLLNAKVQPDTQLIINLLPCNQADLQAELHAVKVADTLSLPVVRTAGTPETLDGNGRFPAFEIPTDKTLTIIRSPHGAGKTHNLARFCEKVCRQGHAVIHILPRTSLVQQARVSFGAVGKREMVEAEAFKDVSSVSNLLFPTDTDGVGNQIAFCVESLAGEGLSLGFDLTKVSRAIDKTGNASRKIFLVLDEFPSVLTSVLTSETISSPAKTMRVFRDLLCLVKGTGGSVLAMSADLSSTEVSFLIDCLELRDEEGKVKQDELFCVSPDVRYPQTYKREIVLSTKKEATLQRIYEAIERRAETTGGAVLVMMNSLKVETPVSTINLDASIREKFPDARTLVLDSRTKQTDKEAQDFLSATPEEQMRLLCDYDCVLATSIIESGLNWDNRAYEGIPDNFVRSIFVIDNGLWGADNILQASMRVRNQAIPCEVFTPKRNNSLERPRLGFYPSLDESLAYQEEVIERAFAFANYADDDRIKNAEAPAWKHCFASAVAHEQARKICPRKTLEVLAKSNGHSVVLTEDSLPQATANAINAVLRQHQEDTVALRSAVIAGLISVEGGARIRKGESTLELERHRSGRWTPDAIKERLTFLIGLNEQLGQAELDNATTPAQKGKVRKKIASLGYLNTTAQQEFEVLNCLSVYGDEARANIGTYIKDKGKQAKAKALLQERVSGDEWFVPRINDEAIKKLMRRRTLTEREEVLVEKQKIRNIGHLDADLTADNTQLSAEAWCRFAYSHQPALMARRLLMMLDETMLDTYGKLIVGEMPQQLTAGRVEEGVGLLQSAETLCLNGIASDIKGFERKFLVDKSDSHLSFVASCLGVEETDDCLNILRIQKTITKNDADAFLVKEIKQGYKKYPQMKLLFADDEVLMELAELIHEHRQDLSALIPSVMKPVRRSNGSSNAIAYLSQVFSTIGLGTFQKLGEVKSNGSKSAVLALVRKDNLLSPAEGLAFLKRKWADVLDKVVERQKFLAISDF